MRATANPATVRPATEPAPDKVGPVGPRVTYAPGGTAIVGEPARAASAPATPRAQEPRDEGPARPQAPAPALPQAPTAAADSRAAEPNPAADRSATIEPAAPVVLAPAKAAADRVAAPTPRERPVKRRAVRPKATRAGAGAQNFRARCKASSGRLVGSGPYGFCLMD